MRYKVKGGLMQSLKRGVFGNFRLRSLIITGPSSRTVISTASDFSLAFLITDLLTVGLQSRRHAISQGVECLHL
jgi:hypothetical protein